jgi:putative hydrolase of the HAD superfamily
MHVKGIRVVFFDAAGTLFRVRGSVGEIYGRAARDLGVDADSREVEIAFRAAFHAKSREGLSHGQAGLRAEKAWWKEVVRLAFADRMTPEVLNRYFENIFEVFRSAGTWELYPETRECLDHLHGRCRLGVISNFDSRLFDVLAGLGIDSYFEHVILSWRSGSAKPDPAIFRRALDEMQVEAAHAVHVGDSPEEDARGAEAAGITGVLLDREDRHTDWPGPRAANLGDLLKMLF